MKNLATMLGGLALAIVAVLSGACGTGALNARLDTLERQNLVLRRQNAQLVKAQAQPVAVPTTAPAPAPVAMPAAPAPAGRAWVRQPHGAYVCTVDVDTHLSLAPRVRFENKVDDRYGMAKTRNDSWVSLTLNGQPVIIVRSTAMGPAVQYHLAPNETCYVELGGADQYKVVATLHKNRGSYGAPALVTTHRQMRWEWDMGVDNDELPFVFRAYQF